MPQYAIMRFQKHKGGGAGRLEAHHERKKKTYASNPDIDTMRSKNNFHIISPEKSYRKEMDERIHLAGCKTRKDSVRFVDTLITASPAFFKDKKRSEIKAYFKCAVEFLSRKIGRDNIFTAVVHMDEKTPHLHLCFTPITSDGRLSAKEIIGNRTHLTKWQDDFFAHMVRIYPDLERGESASVTGRCHIPTRVLKQSVRLKKQAKRIQTAIDGISPFNTGAKKEEISMLLKKFIPDMEDYETNLKKYEREIDRLEKENALLAQKSDDKASLKKKMQEASWKNDYEYLKRFYETLPEEYRQQTEQHLKTGRKNQRLEQ